MLKEKLQRAESYSRKLKVFYQLKFGNKPVVKVHGLLRTGTNYLTSLIDTNFDVFTLLSEEGGWKHGPCEYKQQYYYVFIVKDPYSWIVSFKEWEEIHLRSDERRSIGEFMQSTLTHDKLAQAWDVPKPMDAWNKAIRSWSCYREYENAIFIRYEDLLVSYEAVLNQLREKFSFVPRQNSYKNLEKRADNWKTPRPRKNMDPTFYSAKRYLDLFSDQELEFVRQHIDAELVMQNNYSIIESHG